MKYTIKNGYKVSALTLGTVQLGIPYGVNNTHGMPTYEESAIILQTALDHGITTFDTAGNYGKSQEVLGRFFRENPAEKTLITKVEFSKESKTEIRDVLFQKVRNAAEVLGVTQLPGLLLHNETYLDTYGDALISALRELKAEGLAANIGISFQDKSRMTELCDPDVFDCIQIPASMFDNAEIRRGEIRRLAESGISVYVRSVYLQGLFFRDPALLPPKIQSARKPLEKLHMLAEENNLSIAALAIGYLRDTEGIASLVLGCEKPEQLLESVSLIEQPGISETVRDKIHEISEELEPAVIHPWEWFS